MKIKLVSNVITPYGSFNKNDELDSKNLPVSFLNHLVNDCQAATVISTVISTDTKMTRPVVENKINQTVINNKSVKKKKRI